MLNTLFEMVLRMTFTGSVVALVVLAVRAIPHNKISPAVFQFLWLLVLIRFLCPFSVESELSIFNVLDKPVQKIVVNENMSGSSHLPSAVTIAEDDYVKENDSIELSNTDSKLSNNLTAYYEVKNNGTQLISRVKKLLPYIWLAGFFISLVFIIIVYVSVWIRIRKGNRCTCSDILELTGRCCRKAGIKKHVNVYTSDIPSAPCVFGAFRTKLILPVSYEQLFEHQQLEHILLHELMHIKRCDNAFNYIYLLAACVHWFNPLMWISLSKAAADIEIACDASVLKRLPHDNISEYGRTIVNAARMPGRRIAAVHTGAAGSRSDIKRRVKMIAQYGKKTWIWIAAAVMLISVIAVGCMTSASVGSRLHTQVKKVDVKEVNIWGKGAEMRKASEEEALRIIEFFNSADDFRQNKEFAGETAESGITIDLNEGKSIKILRSGSDFEVQRFNGTKNISYWARQKDLKQLLDELYSGSRLLALKADNSENDDVPAGRVVIYRKGNIAEIPGNSEDYKKLAQGFTASINKVLGVPQMPVKQSILNDIRQEETSVELLFDKPVKLEYIDGKGNNVSGSYIKFLVPLTGTYKGNLLFSEGQDYKLILVGPLDDKDLAYMDKWGVGSFEKYNPRKNQKENDSEKVDKHDIDAVITDYILSQAPHSYASCDVWFAGFERIVWIAPKKLSDGKPSVHIVVGNSCVLGFREDEGILEFPSAGGGGPAILEIEEKDGQYTVISFKECVTPRDPDSVWKEILKYIDTEEQKRLIQSHGAWDRANQQFVKWVRQKYESIPRVKVLGHEMNYIMLDTVENVITGRLRASLIETALKFLDNCAKGDFEAVKPLCTDDMYREINFMLNPPPRYKKPAHGGDYAVRLKGTLKGFYQITDPVKEQDNNDYTVIVGFDTGEHIEFAYLNLKSTRGVDLLVDRLGINP